MLVGQRISQIPPYGLQNYIAGILAALERICHCDRHGLFTLSVLILNFAMKPYPECIPRRAEARTELGARSIPYKRQVRSSRKPSGHGGVDRAKSNPTRTGRDEWCGFRTKRGGCSSWSQAFDATA